MLFAVTCIGIFGFLAMTWLFPALGILFRVSTRGGEIPSNRATRIRILIPAHNEEQVLGKTLESVFKAVSDCRTARNADFQHEADISITVGADGCTDGTAKVARGFGVEVVESREPLGKWRTLTALVDCVGDADWIILADSGVIWPADFIARLVPFFNNFSVIGVAPAYRNPGGGTFERLFWALERHLKSLESLAGGPVSIHGATVAYRASELRAALSELKTGRWLNDDVVIPLVMRSQNPGRCIRYLASLSVCEQMTSGTSNKEFGRRRRMVIGNLQWIRSVLLPVFARDWRVGLIALRRVFRVLWAYWVGALVIATVLLFSDVMTEQTFIDIALGVSVILGFLWLGSQAVRKIFDAAVASCAAPVYLVRSGLGERFSWK